MLAKVKRVILAAAILVAAGVGIRQALREASVAEGMTCTEWQTVLDTIKDRPIYFPLAKLMQAECAGLVVDFPCAEMPDGKICRHGHLYGQGLTTNLPPGDPGLFTAHVCDPSLGTPIPCVAFGDRDAWKRWRDGDIPKDKILARFRKLIERRERGE